MSAAASDDSVLLDLEPIWREATSEPTAKLAKLDQYVTGALVIAGRGNVVVLTGKAPIWLYLRVAHALHGYARRLMYRPGTSAGDAEDVVVFDHDAH